MIGTMKGQQPSQLQKGRASLRTANPELANSRRAGAQGTGLKMSEQIDQSQGERSPEPWKINLPSVDLSKKYGVPAPQTQCARTITQRKKVVRLKSHATRPRTRSVKVLTWRNLVLAAGCFAMVLTVMGGNSELETMTSEFSEVTDAKSLRRALLLRPKNHGPGFSVRSMLLLTLLATVMIVVIMSDGSEAGGSIHHRRLGGTGVSEMLAKCWECSGCLDCWTKETVTYFDAQGRPIPGPPPIPAEGFLSTQNQGSGHPSTVKASGEMPEGSCYTKMVQRLPNGAKIMLHQDGREILLGTDGSTQDLGIPVESKEDRMARWQAELKNGRSTLKGKSGRMMAAGAGIVDTAQECVAEIKRREEETEKGFLGKLFSGNLFSSE